jgi:hypothetical protein
MSFYQQHVAFVLLRLLNVGVGLPYQISSKLSATKQPSIPGINLLLDLDSY